MAGVSDLPFRLVTRKFGCPLAFTEMIDVRALSHRDKRTRHMLTSSPEDRPLGIQLLGNDDTHMMKTLDVLQEYEFDLLDFNAACPTPKVTRKGKGASLLRDPKKLRELLALLVTRAKVPVTVKIRSGWDPQSINAREIALMAEDAGVSALFIHGRTKTQGYSGNVDYTVIRDVKEALRIPVIASGDNLSLPLIRTMFTETGCDGVAIARGALGKPWIFTEMIRHFQGGGESEKADINQRISIMKRHLDLSIQHYGEKRGVSTFHKFFIWYTRGLVGARPFRDRAFRADSIDTFLTIIEELRALPASGTRPGDHW
jgi:tRNA-dihydrouridine synthase B